ncbi:TIGR01777 family oxidoreductase [Pseudoalteromonas denitrificans]|nr:TIGR01777 family oxidoreductase [Pseudoalteromonas denitrificans]
MEFEIYQSDKKKMLITGGSGFIGKRLVQVLLTLNHEITLLSRNINATVKAFKGKVHVITDFSEIEDNSEFDVIINLAGEPLARGRWTKKRKEKFVESRLTITANICELIKRLKHKPEVLINGSAIGYYGPHKDNILDESGSVVDCFSHALCRKWEEQALKAESSDTRVCLLRIGIVLGHDGGPLAELRLPFEYGLSMQISHGQQWMSWIHRDDLIAMILYIMNQSDIRGAVNATAPNPVTNKRFADTLSQHLKTFLRIRVPGKLLSLMIGELADEVLITGQRVMPAKIQSKGFNFTYPELNTALDELIGLPLK